MEMECCILKSEILGIQAAFRIEITRFASFSDVKSKAENCHGFGQAL